MMTNNGMIVSAAMANDKNKMVPKTAAPIPQLRVIINRFGLLELDLSNRDLRHVPDAVFALNRLEVLRLSRNRLPSIQPTVCALRHLRHLDLSHNEVEELPASLADCYRLVELDLRGNRLTSLPATLPGGLSRQLRHLRAAGNRIDELPVEIGRLKELRMLDLMTNRLRELPPSFGDLRQLTVLNLSDNGFDHMPPWLCRLSSLETLDMSKNQLVGLPDDFDRLGRLRELRLAGNRLDSLPDSLCRTSNLVVIDISDNAVTSIPVRLSTLPRLVELNAQRNVIDKFPEVTTGWPNLQRLNVSGNRLRLLPVAAMTSLRQLDCDRNWLTELPQGIYRLTSLESLSMASNRVSHLSSDVALLKRLQVLNISNNLLTSLPKALDRMPNLITLDVTGNNIKSGQRPRNRKQDVAMAYVVDGRSGPLPPGAVPILLAQAPTGLLYATPTAAVHMNGGGKSREEAASGSAAPAYRYQTGRPFPSGSTSSSALGTASSSNGGKSTGKVLGLFRMKNKNSGSSVGGSETNNKAIVDMRAGTQATPGVDKKFPFPPPSDLVTSSLAVDVNHQQGPTLLASNKQLQSPATVDISPGSLPTTSGVDTSSNSRHVFRGSATISPPFVDGYNPTGLQLHGAHVTSRRPSNRAWKSTTDLTNNGQLGRATTPEEDYSMSDDGPPSPVADWLSTDGRQNLNRRNSDRFSDTVTVNEAIGDELSLGEDDFEFLPPNIHDAKLMRIAGDLETLLNKQLLKPIIDGQSHASGNRPPPSTTSRKPVAATSTKNGHQINSTRSNGRMNDSNSPVATNNGQSTFARDRYHVNTMTIDGPRTSGTAAAAGTTTTTPTTTAKKVVGTVQTAEDMLEVTVAGGLFRSTINPDVTVYVPAETFVSDITLRLQVLTLAPEVLKQSSDAVIVAVGQIVILSDVKSTGNVDRLLKQHVTVTVPVPRVVPNGSMYSASGGGTKLHVLTFRNDREADVTATTSSSSSSFVTTCLPCAYDYSTNRRGVVSIRAWNLTGLGAVVATASNAFTVCRSMERILRRLHSDDVIGTASRKTAATHSALTTAFL